jgi:hypothetical protein
MTAFCRKNNIENESLMACLVVTSMSSILRRHSARVACKQSWIYPFIRAKVFFNSYLQLSWSVSKHVSVMRTISSKILPYYRQHITDFCPQFCVFSFLLILLWFDNGNYLETFDLHVVVQQLPLQVTNSASEL